MSADAWIEWSALAEPADDAAGWLVSTLGPDAAREWVDVAARDVVEATIMLAGSAPERTITDVVRASERWARRREGAQAAALRERAQRCGARVVVRDDPEWPVAVDSLGQGAPFALWVRGVEPLGGLFLRSVAIVGARSSTSYGDHVASTIAAHAADHGWSVVSGGAYGIDAAAHRGALAAGGRTLAVMAGGVDRLYPAGNSDLLARVLDQGAVMSEVPPGWAPHRSRFLTRNRLIACASATVVVEAARRSGALSTANRAAELARPVAAVPGPVTSAASAGCHTLVRDGVAVLVTGGADLVELAGPIDLHGGDAENGAAADDTGGTPEFAAPADRAVFDALGRRARDLDALATTAGLTLAEARAALGRLELAGAVVRDRHRWRRKPDPRAKRFATR
ncbi:DNA-processing protein DprA [Demequina aestuarii]|uniref:DNA-processing protein DprA n=1 Tax=Demequina aestuarii TaxID=327095 RepID=UPI0007864D08|nr:DNA-processing protein DprA [Demequina aestuarii]